MTKNCTRSLHILLPTAYLPPVEYFAWILSANRVSIEVHETYPKQTWRNRCRIAAANAPLNLSIPVEKPLGNHTPTGLITLSRHASWQRQHWKSIVSAYSKSAFFMYYSDLLEPFFSNKPPVRLFEWNSLLLNAMLRELEINTDIGITEVYTEAPEGIMNLRDVLSPKYRDVHRPVQEVFPPYFQGFSEKYGFVPNLSIIDLLFNLGPDTKEYLQRCAKKMMEHQAF